MRVIPFGRLSGPMNMALDEAILESVASGASPPTLRFYGWRGRWLSIGLAQSIANVDVEACKSACVGIVRRPSGGTAVLHDHHLAWSITVPTGHPLAVPDIVESYSRHAEITLAALASLGIEARGATLDEARAPLPVPSLRLACFGSLAPHEIVVGDPPRKLVGWGQVRRRGVVMHHAIVPMSFDAAALAGLLQTDRSALIGALGSRVAQMGSARGFAPRLQKAGGWATDLGVGCPTPAERARARQLRSERYAAQSWTFRR